MQFFYNYLTHVKKKLQRTPLSREPVQLTRRDIFILPTRYGLVFGLLFLAMMLGSINYQINLGYALAFFMGSTGLITLVHTFANLLGIVVSSQNAEPVFAGESACFPLVVEEKAGRRRLSIQVRESGPSSTQNLEALKKSTQYVYSRTYSRGIKTPDTFTVFTTYPFGLFRAFARLKLGPECVVYPQPAAKFPHSYFVDPSSSQGSNEKSSNQSGSEDFLKLRNAHPGDSYKRIDWKAFARQRGLVVKQFSQQEQNTVWMDFEQIPEKDTEQKLSILAALILHAYNSGLKFGIRFPDRLIYPDHGPIHKRNCLKYLALF